MVVRTVFEVVTRSLPSWTSHDRTLDRKRRLACSCCCQHRHAHPSSEHDTTLEHALLMQPSGLGMDAYCQARLSVPSRLHRRLALARDSVIYTLLEQPPTCDGQVMGDVGHESRILAGLLTLR